MYVLSTLKLTYNRRILMVNYAINRNSLKLPFSFIFARFFWFFFQGKFKIFIIVEIQYDFGQKSIAWKNKLKKKCTSIKKEPFNICYFCWNLGWQTQCIRWSVFNLKGLEGASGKGSNFNISCFHNTIFFTFHILWPSIHGWLHFLNRWGKLRLLSY